MAEIGPASRAPLAATLVAAAIALGLGGAGAAQERGAAPAEAAGPGADLLPPTPVALAADRVTYDRETGRLIAEGDVEILYEGRTLRAPRIVYDEPAGVVRAEGPIVLVDPEGGVLIADAAELTPDLAEGLIQGARALIARELQVAAVEARRREGRFVTLDAVIASTCTICPGNPTPLWAVRAARIIQDEEAERIYFENARLEVLGAPVGWLPLLSIPDPRVDRASGFLAPRFLNSQIYGAGVKLPYYRVLGPSADATITPFVTSKGGILIEGEYRRRLAGGGYDIGGVIAIDDGLGDDLSPGGFRGALTMQGDFALPRGFTVDFDAAVVSDDVFLKQFDYSNADLLTSEARVRRTRENDDFALAVIGFQSLLSGDDPATVPLILPDFAYRRTLEAAPAGGRMAIDLEGLGVLRQSGDSQFRATAAADWRRDFTLDPGLRLATTASAAFDGWRVWRDGADDGFLGRATPLAMVDLRWPLVRRSASADETLEPIVQVIWSEGLGDDDPPNEDSTLPEFSYTNLFATNRFPGRDRLETGLRANIGVQYLRHAPLGWNLGLTFGRILRATELDQFPEGSGLDGRWSDWVAAAALDFGWGLSLENRALVEDDLTLSRNEFGMSYEGPTGGLDASYVYLAADDSNPALGDQPETSELSLAARYRVHDNWELRGAWRYDIETAANLRAAAGITYGNECVEIDLSVSRRYTSSDNLPAATTISFGLRLAGFGASQSRDWPTRACAVIGAP